MTKILVIAGHGQGAIYDPGAVGVGGVKEADEVRDLMSRMAVYSAGEINYYTARDVFSDRSLAQLASGYDEVVELHFNAFNGSAKGTEVLIHADLSPDELDKRLLKVLSQHWTPRNGGFRRVKDIYNVNLAKRHGISYRLVEVCFIDHTGDMQRYAEVKENLARELVGALLNTSIAGASATAPSGWVKHHDGRYWYQNADGTYPRNEWAQIDGKYYYFDSAGYMAIGWVQDKDNYYYMSASGSQHVGWLNYKDNYYYLDAERGGAMLSDGFYKIGDAWHLFDKDGVMRADTTVHIEKNGKIFI